MSYAEGTSVPIEKSKAEVEQLLRKAGASQFTTGWDEDARLSRVLCRLGEFYIRFDVKVPNPTDYAQVPVPNSRPPRTRDRTHEELRKVLDAEERRRWRALVLIVKAKLEMIEQGMSTVEREFLADIMLPDGGTVGDRLGKQLIESYRTGNMPRLLGAG